MRPDASTPARRAARRLPSRRALLAALAVATALLTFGSATPPTSATRPAARPATRPATRRPAYLLALGDSLAAGYQPSDGLSAPPVDPATGYRDLGYSGSYAADVAAARHLRLFDLACPGETTSSMAGSPAIGQCTATYRAELGQHNQLEAATRFLALHRRRVAVVTFDLGANDVDGCISASGLSSACVRAGEARVSAQLPPILARLRRDLAADDPGARLVAMNYYDPFLGAAYRPGGLVGAAAAALSLIATDAFNRRLAALYARAGVPVANVAAGFRTGAALPVTDYDGHELPLDVADVCRWTWMCPAKGTTTGQDIHPDTAGYRVIARSFEAVLATAGTTR